MLKIFCVKQKSGPLTKECRYIKPIMKKNDSNPVRFEKNEIIKNINCKCFKRSSIDRLELLIALFGFNSSFYTLTFRDDFLPENYKGVQKIWRNFLKVMKRFHGRQFDYIYSIEGKHGDRRYHIHLVLRDNDFSRREVEFLWPGGYIDVHPLIIDENDNFRRIARYLCKERHDGIMHPIGSKNWVASKSLYKALPAPVKWIDESAVIPIPITATCIKETTVRNQYGMYNYASYVNQHDINHARARATMT